MFMEMGTGKTRVAIELYQRLRSQTPHLKMLVIAPLSLLDAAWGQDIQKFSELKYRNCHKDDISYDPNIDVYIINYESFLSCHKYAMISALISEAPFLCVVDESSRIKCHKAKTTRAIISLRNKFQYRVVMSGTPAPNSETEYWPQITFVKSGIFHDNFYAFRNFYFHLEREKTNGQKEFCRGRIYSKLAAQQMFQRGWHYAITNSKRNELMQRIASCAFYARKSDCLDLPSQVDAVRLVEMGPIQAQIYKSMKNTLIAEIRNSSVVAQVALTKIMKLRQITSGFAITNEDKIVEIGESPKLKELENILEEAGRQPVIIWAQFHHEIKKIKELCGERAVTLYGDTKDKEGSIAAFQGGDAQYLIAHPRSAAHGLTFVNCSLQVFYSLDYSWEAYEQARCRIHRAGQLNKCTYVHLLCKGTIDEVILQVLRAKKDAIEILYSMTEGLKCKRGALVEAMAPRAVPPAEPSVLL